MHVYPSLFLLAGSVRSAITLYGMLSSWSQAIRDKEFLVEMRLKNHEPESEVVPENGGEGAAVAGAADDAEGPQNGLVADDEQRH
jgi:hypothetical protein